MIVYQATKAEFLDDYFKRDIQEVIRKTYFERTKRKVSPAEVHSWKESLLYMAKALHVDDIPEDSGVAIEYNIPQTVKRIDFLLTGRAADKSANVIIVELKQWSEAKLNRPGIPGLQTLRGWSHEYIKEVFPGSPRARGPAGLRA